MPPAVRWTLRSVYSLFSLYLLGAHPTVASAADLPPFIHYELTYGTYLLCAFGLIGLWRPVFGTVMLLGVKWQKLALGAYFGSRLSVTDYSPLIEVSIYIMLCAIMIFHLRRFRFFSIEQPLNDDDAFSAMEKVFLFAVAVHFANYFYSGLVKLQIGDTLLSWAFFNKTHYLIMTGWELGQLPLTAVPGLAELTYNIFDHTIIVSNLVILTGQLLSIIAILKIRWSIWITLFYDLTHVVIFIVSGIFFYKWIILNLSFIWAMNTLKDKVIPAGLKLPLIVMILASPCIFFVAHLGWWDTRALNHERVFAIMDDGDRIAIPSNYWGSVSITFGQQRFTLNRDDFFPTGSYGAVMDQRDMERANRCAFGPGPINEKEDPAAKAGDPFIQADKERLGAFFANHHAYVMEHVDDRGRLDYDLFFHHIYSMPWEFDKFNQADKRRIVAYQYDMQAVCVYEAGGRFIRHVIKEKNYVFPVQRG